MLPALTREVELSEEMQGASESQHLRAARSELREVEAMAHAARIMLQCESITDDAWGRAHGQLMNAAGRLTGKGARR